MDEEKTEIKQLKKSLPKKEQPESLEPKETTIINDTTQFSLRIPQTFVKMFNLKGGEKFEFKPIEKKGKIILTGRLKQDDTNGK